MTIAAAPRASDDARRAAARRAAPPRSHDHGRLVGPDVVRARRADRRRGDELPRLPHHRRRRAVDELLRPPLRSVDRPAVDPLRGHVRAHRRRRRHAAHPQRGRRPGGDVGASGGRWSAAGCCCTAFGWLVLRDLAGVDPALLRRDVLRRRVPVHPADARWLVAIGAAPRSGRRGDRSGGRVERRLGRPRRPTGCSTRRRDSPRGLLFDMFVNGTHPLLPWLAFLCAGIVLGRHPAHRWWRPVVARRRLHAVRRGDADRQTRSTTPPAPPLTQRPRPATTRSAGACCTSASALGTALIAFAVISTVAERFQAYDRSSRSLAHAGQMTLTLYIAHVLVFNFVVHWMGWVEPSGLDLALVVHRRATGSSPIALGSLWHAASASAPPSGSTANSAADRQPDAVARRALGPLVTLGSATWASQLGAGRPSW